MLWSAPAFAETPASPNEVSLDLFAFRQADDGGNPYQAEGFDYKAVSIDARIELSDTTSLRSNSAFAWILNDDAVPVPPSISKAKVTSASPDLLTLDAGVWLDFHRPGDRFTYTPGLFYHHQAGYLVGGIDLAVSADSFEQQTTTGLAYNFRFVFPRQKYWDHRHKNTDRLLSHTLLLSWTQILSPSWLTHLGLEIVRQDGLLASTFNYVVLFDDDERPVKLMDENLPRQRNRAQLNARVRYSPRRGTSFGLDTSGYTDDWGVRHAAFQPNLEFQWFGETRWRFWYQLSLQHETKYFTKTPNNSARPRFATQDSDLGSFVMHSPGMIVTVPLNRQPAQLLWSARVALYGFYRDDEVAAAGSNVGATVAW